MLWTDELLVNEGKMHWGRFTQWEENDKETRRKKSEINVSLNVILKKSEITNKRCEGTLKKAFKNYGQSCK